jgi:hypothetical protein
MIQKKYILFTWWLLILSFLTPARTLIHKLVVENDERKEIKIESFGFAANGQIHLYLDGFKVIFD